MSRRYRVALVASTQSSELLVLRRRRSWSAAVITHRLSIAFALTALLSAPVASLAQTASGDLRWFKGNTHTHTLNSDGDSTPDDVVRWYREHGYDFLALTDHNFLTSVEALNALHVADDRFLGGRGEGWAE